MKKYKKIVSFLSDKKYRKIVLGISILLIGLVIGITFSVNLNEEVDSIEITSNDWNETTPVPGSWKVTKSVKWTSPNNARITFDVDTIIKPNNTKKDVVLILDVSGSMSGEKLDKVKSDASELVENILSDEMNRIALITFDTNAEIISTFSNNVETLLYKIEKLSVKGSTNYTDALRKMGEVLEGYSKTDNKDLVALFLSDGYPYEETPNQIGEYVALKDNYPYLTINAIQYEMGSTIIPELIEISDNQYSAYMENLGNVLLDAVAISPFYENFVINDFIEEKYFELGNIENVNVSVGEASLATESGLEKVIWDLGNKFRTGSKATMTLDIKLKDGVEVTDTSVFPTNRKEDITSKLPEEKENKKSSTETPKLKGAYKIIYNANVPNGCSLANPNDELHKPFDTVNIRNDEPTCDGYLFKGWEITENSNIGIEKVTDEAFIMPSKDVYIKGTWTKVAITKAMITEEYKVKYIMPFNNEEGLIDNVKSEYVMSELGIDWGKSSSNTNGKGLYVRAGTEDDDYPIFYYRGEVYNNNVLFANKCWKIVRTTETGGTKLIYNGVPDTTNENGMCANTGTASQLTTKAFNSNYQSPADVGYMFGVRYTSKSAFHSPENYNMFASKNYAPLYQINYMNSTNYFYSKSYTKSGDSYKLGNDAKQFGTWSSNYLSFANDGYYTCIKTTSTETCSILYYVTGGDENNAYVLPISGGKNLDEVNVEMKLASDYIDNGNGTFTLVNPVTVKRTDWSANYSIYKNYYICPDYISTTCSNMYFLSATTSYSFTYMDKIGNIKYAHDVIWNGSSYVLNSDNILQFETSTWSTNYNKLNNNHYTCFINGDTCTNVYYIFSTGSDWLYYIELKNGKKIEDALDEMLGNSSNEFNSTIKEYIEEDWFAGTDGILGYDSYLEDAVWCNDRSIGALGGWNPDGGSTEEVWYILGFERARRLRPAVKNVDACPNKNDRFTVSDMVNGNGKLKYKVGLITASEATIAGVSHTYSDSYLYTGQGFWTLTPDDFLRHNAIESIVHASCYQTTEHVFIQSGVRPAISLKAGVVATNGDGSAANPYRVG